MVTRRKGVCKYKTALLEMKPCEAVLKIQNKQPTTQALKQAEVNHHQPSWDE
jgi:hypothetical protein